MQQTLINIPHELGPLPLFGFGWALICWAIFGGVWLTRFYMQSAKQKLEGVGQPLMPILVIGLIIAFVIPFIEPQDSEGPTGVQIRGYGFFVLLGVSSGILIASIQSRRQGVHPDVVFTMTLFLFLGGVLGGRIWYVAQKWNDFAVQQNGIISWGDTLPKILKFTEGGLVVYGAFVGGLIGCSFFLIRRKLPKLATLDLIAPALALGMFCGRLGCFMNGCCYGGVCDDNLWGVQFPAASPPYMRHLDQGLLFEQALQKKDLGLTAVFEHRNQDRWKGMVTSVQPDSISQDAGLEVGDKINIEMTLLNGAFNEYFEKQLFEETAFFLKGKNGLIENITVEDMPRRSLNVYPAQIYSSINGGLLCLLLWAYFPYRKRDGQILALIFILYPISRFLLEWVRSDELGQLGTQLTISQLFSVLTMLFGIGLWAYTHIKKRPLAYPTRKSLELAKASNT
ncbi:MAG: hypothetical protein CMJ76_05140 [Planctomycetaceae bacterium]|nr:hypothetical protein [Planctomycetaceae bacterium]|tara:strand:+ start:641 stop:1999 length:1359 start_codon:yes stop_codon:yes gene_type:complete